MTNVDEMNKDMIYLWNQRVGKRDTVTLDDYPENTPVRIICSHYFMPFYNKNGKGTIMLHGHTHASREAVLEDEIKAELRKVGHRCEAYNVGAVYLNYAPRTLEEIIALQNRKVTLGK